MEPKTAKRAVRSDKEWKRWAAVPDLHCPVRDAASFAETLKRVREQGPEVLVVLGDLLEAGAASRFENEEEWSLEDEFADATEALTLLEDAAGPGCELVLLEGNHDHNIRREGRIEKRVRTLCDWRKCIPQVKAGKWRVVEYLNCRDKGVYRLGQVTFKHGFSTTQTGEQAEAVLLGVPNGLTVGGHTHRPVPVTQVFLRPNVGVPYWYANAGTLGPLKPEYAGRAATHLWGRAFVFGVARIGRHWWSRPQWKADVTILQMASGGVNRTGDWRVQRAAY